MIWLAPYLGACALLVVAGAAKAARPGDTAQAIAGVVAGAQGRLKLIRGVVRSASTLEMLIGACAAWDPRLIPASLVAASYTAFALYVLIARHKGGALASCGCFGRADTPATFLHAVVDVLLAAAGAGVAASGNEASLPHALAHQPLAGVPLVMMASIIAILCALAMSSAGQLSEAARATRHPKDLEVEAPLAQSVEAL